MKSITASNSINCEVEITHRVRELTKAVTQDDVETFQVLLQSNESNRLLRFDRYTMKHYTSRQGLTLLHIVCVRNRINMAAYLLDTMKMSVNVRSQTGCTPLHIAAWHGHYDMVHFLLDKGASIDVENNRGRTALYQATFDRSVDVADILVQRGASVSKLLAASYFDDGRTTCLHAACFRQQLDMLQVLLRSDTVDLAATDEYGQTVLHLTSKSGWTDGTKLLLHYLSTRRSAKCEDSNDDDMINSRSALDGVTPLHLAANVEIARLLVDFGADINAKESVNNRSPLQHIAAQVDTNDGNSEDETVNSDERTQRAMVVEYLECIAAFRAHQGRLSRLAGIGSTNEPASAPESVWPSVLVHTLRGSKIRAVGPCLVYDTLRSVQSQFQILNEDPSEVEN